jgi:pilus assembly protein Flp/PilA
MGACKTPEGARARVRAFPGAREGVTAIEYGIVAGLIAVVIIAAVNTLGQTALTQLFEKVASSM